LVHFESPTETMDRIDVPDWDKLSMYGQDGLLQLAFVARETLLNWSYRIIFSVKHEDTCRFGDISNDA
jgi:hypothetical protein